MKSQKHYQMMLWPALITITLDQLSKLAVVRYLHVHASIPLVDGFVNLVHVRNRGMAFGLMNRSDLEVAFYALIIISLAAIAIILFWLFKFEQEEGRIIFGLSLILGGAVGNLIDRLRLHEVVDFLDFYLGAYHWPAFNLADTAITVGTFWVVVNLIFKNKKQI